jgi:hypothetical protein
MMIIARREPPLWRDVEPPPGLRANNSKTPLLPRDCFGGVLVDFEECISISFEEPYIIISNKCGEDVLLDSVEVKYYIQVFIPTRREEGLAERVVRKEITERVRVGERIPSGGSVRVYFGSVKNITEVAAIVKRDDKLYRIMGGRSPSASQ